MKARRRETISAEVARDRADVLLRETIAKTENDVRTGLRIGLPASAPDILEGRRRLAAARRALETHKLLRLRDSSRAAGLGPAVVASYDRSIAMLRAAPMTLAAVPGPSPSDRAAPAKKRIAALLEKVISGGPFDVLLVGHQLTALLPKAMSDHDPSTSTDDPEGALAQLIAAMGQANADPDDVAEHAKALAAALGIELEGPSS